MTVRSAKKSVKCKTIPNRSIMVKMSIDKLKGELLNKY